MAGTPEPIVVGIDGSPPSRGALRWALREAGMRRRPLRIVYALADADRDGSEWARSTVCDAAVEARRHAPGSPIDGAVIAGLPAAVLCAESDHAALVVVASRGHGGFADLRIGSVADQLACYARSPVMVVHKAATWVPLGASLTSARPVVVGVDSSPESDLAVGFAFEEAQARGVAVVAVRGRPPAESTAAGRTDSGLAAHQRLLAESLAGWQAKYPYVPVRQRVVAAAPVAALLACAADADLVVVGSQGAGGFADQLLGSVSQQVLYYAPCAVVVVHRHAGNGDG